MTPTLTQPTTSTNTTMVLVPAMTLRGHEDYIRSISYFPNGERMISGSDDLTARQWDMQVGKEIPKLRDVCKRQVRAVAVSRDGRWVVTGGSHSGRGELKACNVQTGIVKTFEGHSQETYCIDISADNTLLLDHSQVFRVWAQFDSRTTRRNLQSCQMWRSALMCGTYAHRDWMSEQESLVTTP